MKLNKYTGLDKIGAVIEAARHRCAHQSRRDACAPTRTAGEGAAADGAPVETSDSAAKGGGDPSCRGAALLRPRRAQ
jgi:hypothetical protein